jgi:hypothetical protein
MDSLTLAKRITEAIEQADMPTLEGFYNLIYPDARVSFNPETNQFDEDATGTLEVVRHVLQNEAALKNLEALMHKYDKFGAGDSEGWQAMRRVEYAAGDGKAFPLSGRNPFQLYESVPGWQTPSSELVAAAEVYWKTLLQERLGVTIL